MTQPAIYRGLKILVLTGYLLVAAGLHRSQAQETPSQDEELLIDEPVAATETGEFEERYDKREFGDWDLNKLRASPEYDYFKEEQNFPDLKNGQTAEEWREEQRNRRQQNRGSDGGGGGGGGSNDFGGNSNRSSTNWPLVLGIFALVVLALMVVLGLKPSFLFRRKGTELAPVAEAVTENIHEMKFETELEKALRLKNYRLATRILYLGVLKTLSDRGQIAWMPNKTNWDYVMELKTAGLKPDFREITTAYDYAWYGEFTIDEPTFRLMQEKIMTFKNKIG
jgi:hypothetical protein